MTCGGQETKAQIQDKSADPVDKFKIVKSVENVVRIKHSLEHTWSIWLYRDASKNWGNDLEELASFDTVEDFWCLYHHMKLPSEMDDGQLSVFKKGTRPEWEHPANKLGGRWLLTLERRKLSEMNRVWTDMVLLMIGENFEGANNAICGAVVNVNGKNNRSKLAIWVTNKNHRRDIKQIGIKLKQALDLKCTLTFHAHNSNFIIYNM